MSTQIQTNQSLQTAGSFKAIFWSGFACGIFDGLAAIIFFYTWYKLSPGQVMQFIASGIYGSSAFTRGTTMIMAGIMIHFLIAFIAAIIYFNAYSRIGMLNKNRYCPVFCLVWVYGWS